MAADMERLLAYYRPYGSVYRPGDKAPVSSTYICDRGTMIAPAYVQLSRGEEFPEDEILGPHARWRATNIQA